MMQNKVEEAERKQKQSQEQVDGVTQQLSELQSRCSVLKAEVQKRNATFKSSEVSVQKMLYGQQFCTVLFSHFHISNGSDSGLQLSAKD